MNGAAAGSLELVQLALIYILALVLRRQWKKDGAEEYRQLLTERRSQRRHDARMGASLSAAARGLDSFPGDDENFEKLASTGELRAYAETGDIGSLNRETAAFFRLLSLREWTRKRESAA